MPSEFDTPYYPAQIDQSQQSGGQFDQPWPVRDPAYPASPHELDDRNPYATTYASDVELRSGAVETDGPVMMSASTQDFGDQGARPDGVEAQPPDTSRGNENETSPSISADTAQSAAYVAIKQTTADVPAGSTGASEPVDRQESGQPQEASNNNGGASVEATAESAATSAQETRSDHADEPTVLDEIVSPGPPERPPYSAETAKAERPYTHYTNPGNLFQVLRFGIQSANFKSNLADARTTDAEVDKAASQMSTPGKSAGATYQTRDSICLTKASDKPAVVSLDKATLLVDPSIETYGDNPGERSSTGYGHGIPPKVVEGKYTVGNETAYPDEVLATNVVPPSKLRAVVMDDRASLLRGLQEVTKYKSVTYSQTPSARRNEEDMLANARLLADLSGSDSVKARVEELAPRVAGMSHNDRVTALNVLHRQALQGMVGEGVPLNETTLRQAISKRFNITILKPSDFS